MGAASVLRRGRKAAESLMVDTCIITRIDPDAVQGEIDDATGQYPPLARLTIYTGPCKFQDNSIIAGSADATAGERQVVTQGDELQLPVADTGAVSVNDVAEILTAPNDPERVGRKYTIKARHEKTAATARRLRVIEVTG